MAASKTNKVSLTSNQLKIMFPFKLLTIIFYNSTEVLIEKKNFFLTRQERELRKRAKKKLQYKKHSWYTGLDFKAFWRWKKINKKNQQQLCNNSIPRIANSCALLARHNSGCARWCFVDTISHCRLRNLTRWEFFKIFLKVWRFFLRKTAKNWLLMITFASIKSSEDFSIKPVGNILNIFTDLWSFLLLIIFQTGQMIAVCLPRRPSEVITIFQTQLLLLKLILFAIIMHNMSAAYLEAVYMNKLWSSQFW